MNLLVLSEAPCNADFHASDCDSTKREETRADGGASLISGTIIVRR